MTPLDQMAPDVVQKIIHVFGVSVKLSRTVTVFDPLEKDSDLNTVTDYPVKVSPPFPFEQKQINGATILATDLQFIVPALDLVDVDEAGVSALVPLEPQGWTILFREATYQIIDAQPIFSGESVAAYQIQARG